jgi:hypothetical protein
MGADARPTAPAPHHPNEVIPHAGAVGITFAVDDIHDVLERKRPAYAGLSMGDTGLEPVTSALSRRRSPS